MEESQNVILTEKKKIDIQIYWGGWVVTEKGFRSSGSNQQWDQCNIILHTCSMTAPSDFT